MLNNLLWTRWRTRKYCGQNIVLWPSWPHAGITRSITLAKHGRNGIDSFRNLAKLLNECRHKLKARYVENDLRHDHSLLAWHIFSSRKSVGHVALGIKSTCFASLMEMKQNEMDGRRRIERATGRWEKKKEKAGIDGVKQEEQEEE